MDCARLTRLKRLSDRYEPIWVSKYLAWSSYDDVYFGDLLPLPYTKETLGLVVDRVDQTQSAFGALTLTILTGLAATSNDASIRRMGGKRWTALHRLVYLAATCASVHFLLLVKSWPFAPICYVVVMVLLLAFRLWRPRSEQSSKPEALTPQGPL